jgi:hypothetical protein
MSDDFEQLQVHSSKGRTTRAPPPCCQTLHTFSRTARIPPRSTHQPRDTTNMSYNQRQPHGGPAGAPPSGAPDFNAMLQRSLHEPGHQELAVEAPGRPSSSIGEGADTRVRYGSPRLTRLQAMEVYTARPHHHNMGQTYWAEQEGRRLSRSSPWIYPRKLS